MKNALQQRIKLIASKSLLTKVLADFLSVIYLLTLVLKTRNKSYTNTLCVILKPAAQTAHLVFADTQKSRPEKTKRVIFCQPARLVIFLHF